MGVFFSIIIPVYNGEQYIKNCLDGIYRQGLGDDDFEVICVNDCSTDNTAQVISEYGKFHQNLRLINHETNRRQGSARNTGVKVAKGDYILYIDADDTFESNALPLLRNVIEKNKDLDILKFDYTLVERNGSTKNIIEEFDSQDVMSGHDFIKRNSIPWSSWLCAYRRLFLLENNILFRENVRFEDADYIINCIRIANRIQYAAIVVYNYIMYDSQTTKIGCEKNKIVNFFEQSDRIKKVAYKEQDKDVSNCIMRHHFFMYKMNILRYWWRLSYKDRKELLVTYKPMLPCKDKSVSFIGRYPRLFFMVSTIVKPLLPGLRYVYLKIKDRKSSLL